MCYVQHLSQGRSSCLNFVFYLFLFKKKETSSMCFIPVSIKAILFYSGMYRYSNNYPVVRVEVSGYIVSIDSREKLTTYGGRSILMVIKLKITLNIFFECIDKKFQVSIKRYSKLNFFPSFCPVIGQKIHTILLTN